MEYEFSKQFEAEKTEIQGFINKIKESGIFDSDYLNNIKLAFPTADNNKVLVHQNEKIETDDSNKYTDIRGFELGIRQDFIPLEDKQSFEAQSMQMHDNQRIQELFYSVGIPYDEFIAHELGHNVYDKAYVKSQGEFEIYGEQDPNTKETKGIMTEVSDEYRAKIIDKLKTLLAEARVNLDVKKFFGDEQNNRQKIAEIFALIIQREYAMRLTSSYLSEHQAVDSRVKDFLDNPEKVVAKYNQTTGRQVTIEDFYRENHILSFVVVPLLENKYKSFRDRINFLEVKPDKLLTI